MFARWSFKENGVLRKWHKLAVKTRNSRNIFNSKSSKQMLNLEIDGIK